MARFRRDLVSWYRGVARDLPWRRTTDPYAVMVSEFMCQQTTVTAVIPYFERWLAKWPTVQALAAAGEDDVLAAWEGLGYYSRGRNLRAAAVAIVERFAGEVPATFAELRSLPGVGDYTAAAVLAFAFDQRAAVVDANVARVLARLADFREPIDTRAGRDWLVAESLSLQDEAAGRARGGGGEFNSALMELGALVCRARSPRCEACPVRRDCSAEAPGSLPVKRPRAEVTRVTERREWIWDGSHLWLERAVGPRWRGMWILPLAPIRRGVILHVENYAITRYNVRMEVVAGRPREGLQAFDQRKIAGLAIPAPHRRVVDSLLGGSVESV